MRDKTTLFVKRAILPLMKAIVVIVHGVCEHNERYDYITSALNNAGFSVVRFDLRGHGKSGGERGYAASYHEFSDDLNEIISVTGKDFPDIPVFVLGHSMGAFISALYEILYPDRTKGQILSGIPAIVLPLSDIKLLKKLPYNKFPKMNAVNKLAKLVSKDPQVVQNYIEDPLNLKKSTIKMSAEMFLKGPEYLAGHINNSKTPCLVLHGQEDKIVTEKSSEWFYENISSLDKTRKVYPGLYHEIFNEPERDYVIDDVIKWLEERT
jgi:alpha-beta hydrolase superfamily lysophospholipase